MKADRKFLFLVLLFLPFGKTAGQLQSSIIGGREALPHSRPYMVSIHKGGIPACGGVLVHARWVLTAAHCYSDLTKGPVRVMVGLHRQPRGNARVQVFTVAKFVPHPSYNRVTMANDIMLLKLDKKVVWNKETSLLPLSKKNPAPGTLCSVAGWGRFREGSKYSPVLRELDVKVMDIRMCNNSRYWHGEVTSTMMCIQGIEKGSAPCQGDSGGPVVCGKKAAVAGVISFTGKSCVDVFKPPVATAVFKYKMWIKKYLRWGSVTAASSVSLPVRPLCRVLTPRGFPMLPRLEISSLTQPCVPHPSVRALLLQTPAPCLPVLLQRFQLCPPLSRAWHANCLPALCFLLLI